MQIVILAGGIASRLYPLTKKIPKSMIKVCEKPFFNYQIDLLKKNQIDEIVMCIGIFSEQIIDYFGDGKKFGISIKYSKENPNDLLGTCGAIKNAEKYLDEVFFVMYGDSYLPINFNDIYEKFLKSKKYGLMTIYKNQNKFDTSNVAIENDLVSIYDKSQKNKNLQYIDYGLSILNKQVLNDIPSNKFVDLEFLFKQMIEKKMLTYYISEERFYEIGSEEGIRDFENFVKSL